MVHPLAQDHLAVLPETHEQVPVLLRRNPEPSLRRSMDAFPWEVAPRLLLGRRSLC